MKNTVWILTAFTLFAPAATSNATEVEMTPLGTKLTSDGFEVIARANGVTAYKHKTSEIIRIAAEGTFAASPEVVMQALLDYEGQVGKIDRVSKSRILDRGPSWILVYQQLNLPIISDRDYVMYVDWGADGDNLYITYRAGSHRGPSEQDGVVRVTYHLGSWQLKPILDGTATRARFQSTIDLAGWLPKWLARSKAGDELPGLFQNVRRMLSQKQNNSGGGPCVAKSC
jgi:hypothetical protein